MKTVSQLSTSSLLPKLFIPSSKPVQKLVLKEIQVFSLLIYEKFLLIFEIVCQSAFYNLPEKNGFEIDAKSQLSLKKY